MEDYLKLLHRKQTLLLFYYFFKTMLRSEIWLYLHQLFFQRVRRLFRQLMTLVIVPHLLTCDAQNIENKHNEEHRYHFL